MADLLSTPPVAPTAQETVHVSINGPFTGRTYDLDVPSFDPSDPTHLEEIKNRVREMDQGYADIAAKQAKEKKREFNTRLDTINQNPTGPLEAASMGALDTALAGTPEALARMKGVPQSEIDATKVANPWSTFGGEVGGAFMPLGAFTKAPKVVQGIREGIKTGARIGGIYGLGAGAANSIKGTPKENPNNPFGQLVETGTRAVEGAQKGAVLGALFGAAGSFLGGFKKNVMELGEDAKNYLFSALKAGRGTGEGDAGKYEKDIVNAVDLIAKDQPPKEPIKNLNQLVETNQNLLDQKAIEIDKQLTKAGQKGIFVPGSEVKTDYVRNALFPNSFQKQLSSSEVQTLNDGINTLMTLKGKSFSGKSLDGLAEALLSHSKYDSIPKETRIQLVNKINSIDRDGGHISGDDLMAQGLRGLKPSATIPGHDPGLNIQGEQINAIVDQASKFGGKKQTWTPWELEDRIQKINDEVAIVERKVPDSAKSAMQAKEDVASLQNEQNVLRTKLDEVMSSGPNGEFRKEKYDLGTLMRMRRVAETAKLAEREGKGVAKTEGIKGVAQRFRGTRSIPGALSTFIKTDKDLSPSERVAKGFETWALSKKQPTRIGQLIGNTKGMRVLEGLKKAPGEKLGTKELIQETQ